MDQRFMDIISNEKQIDLYQNIDNKDDITDDADHIKKLIKNISHNNEKMEKILKSITMEVNPTMLEKQNKEFKMMSTQTQNILSQIKNKLDNISNFTKLMLESNKKEVRENIHSLLIRELSDILIQCGNLNEKHKKITDEKITREIKIINPNITINEIEMMKEKIQNNELNQSIFANTFISEEHSKARENLRYYREMYKDVIELEKQFSQIKQMFIDLSILVCYQGDLIKNIEHNVTKSKIRIQRGNKQLEQAVKRSQSKCRIC